MINKKNLFQHSRMFFYVILGFVFLTQSLSCEDDWKPEPKCEQYEAVSVPDWNQSSYRIHVLDYVYFTLDEPKDITNYDVQWEFEGGTPKTYLDVGGFGSNNVRVRYLQPGSFKVTCSLVPTLCSDYDTKFRTRNPAVTVEP